MIIDSENTTNNKKILVVDDDEGIVDAISLILEDEGYTVETIADGNQTFDTINSFNPDLIILDVLLSGSDGRTICSKLKNDAQTKTIPIIMISAHPNLEDFVAQSKADTYLPKPFDAKTLLTVITQYI